MAVIVDTSFIVSMINGGETAHQACVEIAQHINTALIVPVTVLPEAAYLIESRLGHPIMRMAVAELLRPAWTLESLQKVDLERALEILTVYGDSRLDFVDSTVIAIAERLNVRQILSLDRRHFHLIRPRHCPAFELLPN